MRLKEFLQYGGLINNPSKVQNIINKYGNGKSQLTANDYIEVSKSTGVPIELLLAQGAAESNFGTRGRAVRTRNVGNVGNTDSGAAEYRNSWKDGLYRQANLLKNEYNVTGQKDIQRLLDTRFARPRGGHYASNPNYSIEVGRILNSITGNGFNINSTSQSFADEGYEYQSQGAIPLPSDMKPLEYKDTYAFVMDNPGTAKYLNDSAQKEFEESVRLSNEKERQDQIMKQTEYENQQIAQALEAKKAERNQILAMIPQSAVVTQGMQPNIPRVFQSGGRVDYNKVPYDINDIRKFYNDMTTSTWYRDRLMNNGYVNKLNPLNWTESGRQATAQEEADYRARRLKYAKLNKIDDVKPAFSAEEALRVKELMKTGTHYDPVKNEVNFRLDDPRLNIFQVTPGTAITHEFGHAESAYRLSNWEEEQLTNRLSNRTKDDHDTNPNENKADINTVRYNLYKSGLYNPKTGKYKTKSGKFEASLLQNIKDDFVTKRLMQNYDTKNIEFLLNTIAMNENQDEDLVYVQKGGKVGINNMNKIYKNEINNAINFEKEYINSPKFKERVQKQGYNYDEYKKDIQNRLNDIRVNNTRLPGSYTAFNVPGQSNMTEIYVKNGDKEGIDDIGAIISHEIGHEFDNSNMVDFINNANQYYSPSKAGRVYQKIDYFNPFSSTQHDSHEASADEMSADVHAARYELSQLMDGYDGRYSNFTDDAYEIMKGYANNYPNSASSNILKKTTNKDMIRYNNLINQKKKLTKEEEIFVNEYSKNVQKHEETQKRNIFKLMNRIVFNNANQNNNNA